MIYVLFSCVQITSRQSCRIASSNQIPNKIAPGISKCNGHILTKHTFRWSVPENGGGDVIIDDMSRSWCIRMTNAMMNHGYKRRVKYPSFLSRKQYHESYRVFECLALVRCWCNGHRRIVQDPGLVVGFERKASRWEGSFGSMGGRRYLPFARPSWCLGKEEGTFVLILILLMYRRMLKWNPKIWNCITSASCTMPKRRLGAWMRILLASLKRKNCYSVNAHPRPPERSSFGSTA